MKRHMAHRVYVKRLWADPWVLVEGLYCDWFTKACSPDVSAAECSWTYGRVMPPGETDFGNRFTLGYEGYYIRIDLDQTPYGTEPWSIAYTPIRWYGVIVDSAQDRGGIGENPTVGKQKLICRGLEYILQRTIVDSSFVKTATGETEIGRAIAFNLGSGEDSDHIRKDNRSTAVGVNGSYIFAASLDEADCEPWYGDEIADYLLAYHHPEDKNGIVKIPFELDPGFSASVLRKFSPTLHAEGKTVKEVLDELIDRRRGIAWYVDVNVLSVGGVVLSETPQVVVVTFNKDIIVLPSGTAIPANPDQTVWLFDDLATIRSHTLVSDTAAQFDRVIARGERLGACFTVSYQTTTLEKDWTDAIGTAYNAGATGAAGYGALATDYDRMSANQQFRRADKFLKAYRYFRVPPTWDGFVEAEVACPDPDNPAGATTPFWYAGLRFKDSLPLLTERSYATVASITSEELTKSKAEYLRPFALIYDVSKERYYYTDRMAHGGALADDLPDKAGRDWSANLRMQDDALGIIVDVSGHPQHAIASFDFTPADDVDTSDYSADMPWQQIYATVFAEFDQHLEARWPLVPLTTDADAIKELIIQCANMRLDYLTPGTAIGIDSAGAVIESTGGYVRDDRTLLKDIARSAYQWYGQTRQALSVVRHYLVPDVNLGTLVTFVGDAADLEEVNSVVTSQTFNVAEGTIATQTQFAQLDLRGVT
jgi:hypothetical protein